MAVSASDLAQIPMSADLGKALAWASEFATSTGATDVTLEHLLAALCDDPDAIAVLDASRVAIPNLKADISAFIFQNARRALPAGSPLGVSVDVRRILEAAAAAARGSRRRDINGAIVLAAIVGDARSVAAETLQAHGLTFEEAIRALQTTLAPQRNPQVPVADDILARARERVQSRAAPTLNDMMKDMPKPAQPAVPIVQQPATPPPPAAPLPAAKSPDAPLPQPTAKVEPPSPAVEPAPTKSTDVVPAETKPETKKPDTASESKPETVDSKKAAPPSQVSEALTPAAPVSVGPSNVDTGKKSETRDQAKEPAKPQPPTQTPIQEPSPTPTSSSVTGSGGTKPKPAAQDHPAVSLPSPSAAVPVPSSPPPQAEPALPFPAGFNPLPSSQAAAPPPGQIDPRKFSARPAAPGIGAAAPASGDVFPDLFPDLARRRPVGAQPPPIPPAAPMPMGQPGIRSRAPAPVAIPAPFPHGAPGPSPGMRPGSPMAIGPAPGPAVAQSKKSKRGKGSKVETGQLAENIPRTMRVGKTERAEVRIAKASIKALTEGLEGGGAVWQHSVAVTKAMAVRLRAPEGGFFIETASPETQWIENTLGFSSDDFASWRFAITPQARGWARLQIIVSARTVGGDGVAAETALPDQVIEVKVRRNMKRALARLFGWTVAAVSGGALSTFGETGIELVKSYAQKFLH